jgi:hypothetical protein
MKYLLEFLRKDRKLTPFEISEILQIQLEDVKSKLIESGVDKDPPDRKYYLIKKVPMTNEQKEFIVGEIISGANISKHGKNDYRIVISSKNREHIYWKKIILGNFVNVILSKKDIYTFSINHNDLVSLKRNLWKDNKKVIPENVPFTDVTLSSLFLNLAKPRGETYRLSLGKYGLESCENLQFLFKQQGIRTKICEYSRGEKKSYYMSINKRNSNIYLEKIKYQLKFYNEIFNSDSQRLHAEHSEKNDDIV